MEAPTIKISNCCNFSCLHCLTSTPLEPVFMDVSLFDHIVNELKDAGFTYVGIAGAGEATLHPRLDEILGVLVRNNMEFEILTNGYLFKERLLPLLKSPSVRRRINAVGFSLDGAREETHDSLRREGSFFRIMEAIGLCKLLGIPFYVKTVVTNRNKGELKELLLFTSGMGAMAHMVISPMPTRRMLQEEEIPCPGEVERIFRRLLHWKRMGVFPILRLEAWSKDLFACNAFRKFGIDEGGNYLFCNNLGNVETDGGPLSGRECLGNLKDTGLGELVVRHFKFLPQVLQWRFERRREIGESPFSLCYWCFCQFEKLGWLREWPNSPWSRGVLSTYTV